MNEELNNALAEVIQAAVSGIDGAVLFTQEHLPDVVYQVLLWHGVKSAVFFVVVPVFLFSISAILYGPVSRFEKEDTGDAVIAKTLAIIFAFAGIFSIPSNLTWLQIWIAPKLYLLEYAASLVK